MSQMEFFVPLSIVVVVVAVAVVVVVDSAIDTVEPSGLDLAGLAVLQCLGLAFPAFAAIASLGLAVLLAVIFDLDFGLAVLLAVIHVLGLCFAFAVVQSEALFALVCSEDLSCFPDLVTDFSVDFASWDPSQS